MELESKIERIETMFAAPDFFTKNGDQSEKLHNELTKLKAQLEKAYARWEELENKLT